MELVVCDKLLFLWQSCILFFSCVCLKGSWTVFYVTILYLFFIPQYSWISGALLLALPRPSP